MKFDYIIQNPPYSKSLHLDFFCLGVTLLEKDGAMVIVEPATWLINVRKNGKASKYDEIKKRIEGHVESVVIENLNEAFETDTQALFATTTIDMSRTFDSIDFACCGERRKAMSLYDCNLVGDYNLVWSILHKCREYGTHMDEKIEQNGVVKQGTWYLPYNEILTFHGYESMVDFVQTAHGLYRGIYTTPVIHKDKTDISDTIEINKNGNFFNCVCGAREELENWKYFVLNNKLPLFINICLTIDQHNNSKDFMPWLVDRHYTDDEINRLFGFTDEEIRLIDKTLRKFERSSPWFRRHMCGRQAASEDEISGFLEDEV